MQPGSQDHVSEIVARIRAQWRDVIGAIAAASQGNPQAAAQLGPFLDDMSGQEDWGTLAGILRRILNGERDPQALLAGLDDTESLIVSDTLAALGVDVSAVARFGPETAAEAGPASVEDDGGETVRLDEFLAMVVQACRPGAPAGLGEQLYQATRGMATQPGAPAGINELGRALNAILSGDLDPGLAGLPPDLAARVRGVLDAIRAR